MRPALIAFALMATSAYGQWQIQNSGTTASLRGITSVGDGVAWASGTGGTVLKTEDGGKHWTKCAVPPDAEKLDFRGVQAFDVKTAIVMSSGKGDLSRLYKTVDGCATWNLVFSDPDEEGFFDALRIVHDKTLQLLGDPVGGKFAMFFSDNGGNTWLASGEEGRDAPTGIGAFAASNSSLIYVDPFQFFAAGASTSSLPAVYRTQARCVPPPGKPKALPLDCTLVWIRTEVPLAEGSSAAGAFSLAARMTHSKDGLPKAIVVAVGGVYNKPDDTTGTAVFTIDGGVNWSASAALPHGYRSAVTYDAALKRWITVGPNGTDVSTDDGRNWRPLTPATDDAPDADKNWNALSLPFVVGPKGRIGILRTQR